MEAADTKIRFINTIKIMAKGNKSAFARMLGIKPQDLYAYENGKTRIGIDMRERILRIGINPEYLSGKSIFMFADNEQGQILKQKFGDKDMSSMQNGGVRVIPTTNPLPRKIPIMLSPARAGLASWVSDSIGAEIDISKLYHEHSYFVEAHGDSMTGARIQSGDLLLIDESKEPKNNDIVLAEIDGGYTVKRLKKNGVQWLLHPDSKNTSYAPIEVSEEVRIIGVVVQIIIQS
jgi:DNA polymerase V